MKIDTRNIASILKDTGKFRVFLIYGENTGLVRERAIQLVKKIVGNIDDPFLVCTLDKDHHDRLLEEATALSLMGGQRTVWVREGGDHLSRGIESFLEPFATLTDAPIDSVVIIEAGSLTPRSSLRVLAEKHSLIASIPCYAETGRSLEETVRGLLGKKRINPDAFRTLMMFLGADRALIRNEIEKLLLYVGSENEITIQDIEQAIGDGGEYSAEDIVYAAMSGQVAQVDRALERTLKEGITVIAIIRALLYYTDRLLRTRFMIEEGIPAKTAISKLSPPVFFTRSEVFLRTVDLWHKQHLLKLLQHIQKLEFLCKQTAVPSERLCCHFLLILAQQVRDKKTELNVDKLFSNW